MLFTEFRFFPFFLLCFLVYWAMKRNGGRKLWLTLCSYAFYAAWDWRFLSLIIISTVVDYVAGIRIDEASTPGAKKRWLTASLAANLGMLGFFKYFGFFVHSAGELIEMLGFQAHMPTLVIILPVGISFFTFQTMSYSLDIYAGKLKPTRSFLDLAFFVSFFPQLVAGPIVRAKEFLPQVTSARTWAPIDVKTCLMVFLIGFIKKAVVADNLAPFVDKYFENPELYTALSAWVATLFYAVQIYCDFSGYSDMAIACAALLGYELCRNFNFPYMATNITEFWRRWHMSLSTWLRDYLYIPLGGSRGGKLFTYRNLMLTMVLGGLWHGAAWNFVIWGFLHGIALVIHKEWTRLLHVAGRAATVSGQVLGAVFTFYWVCIAWIFFRCGSLDLVARNTIAKLGKQIADPETEAALLPRLQEQVAEAAQVSGLDTSFDILRSFVLFQSEGAATLGANLLGVFAVLAVVHYVACAGWLRDWWARAPDWAFAAFYGAATAIVLMFVPVGNQPFIYFQF